MEYLGKDRYFKYRYVEETPINITTITEAWELKSQASLYKIMEDYLKKSINLKVCYEGHNLSSVNFGKSFTAPPHVYNNANVIMIAMRRAFFDGQQEYFSPSPVFETAKTIIVSAAPKKVTSTSLSFLNMDAEVVILTVSSVVLLSLLLIIHSIVTNKYKSLPIKRIVKKMAQETLENVWENASLICAEPIPSVLPQITCRLLASSWLIGVTFILFFLGCYLRTEFTKESYNRIDTLSDLIKSGIPPTIIKPSGTLNYLKYLAKQDPVVKEWLDAHDEEKLLGSRLDYMKRDGYIPILFGEKALLEVDTYLMWTMGGFLRSDPVSKMFLAQNGGLYISQQDVGFDYIHLIFNTSWLRSSPQIHENLQLCLEPIFETQVFKYLYFENHYIIEQVKWKRPLKVTDSLDLGRMFVPFYLLFTLLSGTVAAVITEIIFFNHFA